MNTLFFYYRRAFSGDEISAEVYLNGACIGEFSNNPGQPFFYFNHPDLFSHKYISAHSIEELAQKIVATGWFAEEFTIYGIMGYKRVFKPSVGFQHIAEYNSMFPKTQMIAINV